MRRTLRIRFYKSITIPLLRNFEMALQRTEYINIRIMTTLKTREPARFSLADAAKARVATYLYQVYANDAGLLGDLDRWTQRRITDENMAKLALVFASDDPAEACYRDLIREIDTEAETGIYLVKPDATSRHLRRLIDEPGISGQLHREMIAIAPKMFEDETAHSAENLDLVWVAIQARHDRAHVDAMVSEIIMSHLIDNVDSARDMCNAMRALQYSFHENLARRCSELPLLLDDRHERDLMIMVTELVKRSGSYEDRNAAIRDQVDIRILRP